MKVFYWVMALLIAGSLIPSVFFLLTYAATGIDAHGRRARLFWNYSRLFAMAGLNILVWGHVIVGLWQIWFH